MEEKMHNQHALSCSSAPLSPPPYREDGILAFVATPPSAIDNSRIVLCAESDSKHLALIRKAFRKAPFPVRLHHVEDGESAVNYMRGTFGYYDRRKFPLPQVLLSGTAMGPMGGLALLAWVRADKNFEQLPVILLGDFDSELHQSRTGDLRIDRFIQKDELYRDPQCLARAVNGCLSQTAFH
jgi:CheY-like chemotaxis protein